MLETGNKEFNGERGGKEESMNNHKNPLQLGKPEKRERRRRLGHGGLKKRTCTNLPPQQSKKEGGKLVTRCNAGKNGQLRKKRGNRRTGKGHDKMK